MFEYNNIGEKIKGWAVGIFIIEAIFSIIAGISIIATAQENPLAIISGLLFVFLGPIIAWVSSWLLYGFGQLIENSDIIVNEIKNKKAEKSATRPNTPVNKATTQKQPDNKPDPAITPIDFSDDEFIDITCKNCGATLSFTNEQLENKNTVCPLCDAKISVKIKKQ